MFIYSTDTENPLCSGIGLFHWQEGISTGGKVTISEAVAYWQGKRILEHGGKPKEFWAKLQLPSLLQACKPEAGVFGLRQNIFGPWLIALDSRHLALREVELCV